MATKDNLSIIEWWDSLHRAGDPRANLVAVFIVRLGPLDFRRMIRRQLDVDSIHANWQKRWGGQGQLQHD